MKHNWISLLKQDLNFIVYQKGTTDKLRFLKAALSPSFICTFLYRFSHLLFIFRVPLVPRLFWWFNLLIFGVDIDQRSKLYGALYLPHPMNICIGQHVTLSGSAKIMQGATLGGNLGKRQQRNAIIFSQPTLQGQVFIGINSIVAGPVLLSGNIFIAAMQIVGEDITDDGLYFQQQLLPLKSQHLKELGVICDPTPH